MGTQCVTDAEDEPRCSSTVLPAVPAACPIGSNLGTSRHTSAHSDGLRNKGSR